MATDSVLPVTVSGWFSLIISFLTIATVFIGIGRIRQKFEDHGDKLKDLEEKYDALDPDLADTVEEIQKEVEEHHDSLVTVKHTLWGVRGDNGMSKEVKDLGKSVASILDRNTRMDAITEERMRGAQMSGDERRSQHRRAEDRVAFHEQDPNLKEKNK